MIQLARRDFAAETGARFLNISHSVLKLSTSKSSVRENNTTRHQILQFSNMKNRVVFTATKKLEMQVAQHFPLFCTHYLPKCLIGILSQFVAEAFFVITIVQYLYELRHLENERQLCKHLVIKYNLIQQSYSISDRHSVANRLNHHKPTLFCQCNSCCRVG